MKLLPDYLWYFISPITGKLSSHSLLPALEEDYVWEGDVLNRPIPSPVLIDIRLDAARIQNQVDIIAATYLKASLTSGKIWIGNSENKPVESSYVPFVNTATFVLKTAEESLPNAQALDELDDGVMINTEGEISTSDDFVQFEGTSYTTDNIAIWASTTGGKFIKDSGYSMPDLEELVEQAEAAAEAAEEAQAAAEAAASEATASAAAAAGSATAAAASASAAALSEAAAIASAAAAALSAASASSSASDAEGYRDECQAIYDSLAFLSTMTNGQLIIGSTGVGPVAATLTAGSGVSIVNGAGTITISASGSGGTVTSVSGTAGRITSSGGTTPIIDIDPTYIGQSSITTLGTITSGAWNGTKITEVYGGTNQSTYTLGDLLYASATNTLAKLSGNTTTTAKYLSQTGNGTISAAPTWAVIPGTDITGAALTKTDDTNVTLTLGGTPGTALLRAASLTLGWTGELALSRGGTNANLTASNGGIVYSAASALAILAASASSNQLLISGGAGAPSWTSRIIDYGAGFTGGLGNLFIGSGCGKTGITGNPGNTGIGIGCLASLSTSGGPGFNTVVGNGSGAAITTGSNNVLMAFSCGSALTTGTDNILLGVSSGNAITSGVGNILIGTSCGAFITTNGSNVFLGNATGTSFSGYSSCVLIGHSADCSSNNLTNAIAIGNGASVGASNSLVLGNGCNVGIGTSIPRAKFSVGNPSAATTVTSLANLYNTVQNSARIVFTGQEVVSSSNLNNEGMCMVLALNRTNNRGIGFMDSTHAFNSTNCSLRISVASTSAAAIASVSTDNSAYRPLFIEGTTVTINPVTSFTSSTDSVYKPTAGSWLSSSDVRIKRDIRKYNSGLKEILGLNVVYFKFNEYSGFNKKIRDKENIGFIADEVLEVMPECVGEMPNKKFGKIKSLDITPITYALVNAVKELKEEINALKKAA